MIWFFKENSFEVFENNVRVTTPLALWRGAGGEAFFLFGSNAFYRVLQSNAVGLQVDND